ncbi:hypothetical protein AtDm6_2737 [Acetobacter tropicalis]|uniref:Uncharacterized protein n=1 Tax=Acetobacter tropicalis TaxID=104102 RepID=A0A095AXM2_9PROT|nr:hypothetical protein AtDm6_2737 [Acetobacter tropicalis]
MMPSQAVSEEDYFLSIDHTTHARPGRCNNDRHIRIYTHGMSGEIALT